MKKIPCLLKPLFDGSFARIAMIFFFLFITSSSFGATTFSTNFNTTDLFFVLIPAALVAFILLALKHSIVSLEQEQKDKGVGRN
jgi:hypothetical protein